MPQTVRWYWIPLRVLLLSFLLTLLAFATGLLLGIVGLVSAGLVHGVHPNLTSAYRHVALPAGVVVATVALVVTSVMEMRSYRRSKVLSEIERASQWRSGN